MTSRADKPEGLVHPVTAAFSEAKAQRCEATIRKAALKRGSLLCRRVTILERRKSGSCCGSLQFPVFSHSSFHAVTTSREHGSAGKRIGQLVAQKMGIPCYYKEMVAIAAQESGLAEEYRIKMVMEMYGDTRYLDMKRRKIRV